MTTLSIERILAIRSEAFAEIRALTDRLQTVGNAIEQLDAALLVIQTDNSSDEQQALVNSARALVAVLSGDDQDQYELQADHRDIFEDERRARGIDRMPELPTLAELMGDVA